MSAVESTTLKPEDSPHKFTPRETSKIQHQELSKTVFSHVINLHSQLTAWGNNRAEGFRVARQVRNLNLPECDEDYIPSPMGPLMDSLLDTLNALQYIVKEIKLVNNQLQALAKLQQSDEPVLVTWSVKLISEKVIVMYEMAKKELELLEKVTENIGHCRDANMLTVYMESWRPGTYVCSDHYSYLFSEALLPPVSCPT